MVFIVIANEIEQVHYPVDPQCETEMKKPATIAGFNHHVGEWTYIRKDGSSFPVQLYINPMRHEQGAIIGYIGVAFDISEIKKIEFDLQKALEKERELGRIKIKICHHGIT